MLARLDTLDKIGAKRHEELQSGVAKHTLALDKLSTALQIVTEVVERNDKDFGLPTKGFGPKVQSPR